MEGLLAPSRAPLSPPPTRVYKVVCLDTKCTITSERPEGRRTQPQTSRGCQATPPPPFLTRGAGTGWDLELPFSLAF